MNFSRTLCAGVVALVCSLSASADTTDLPDIEVDGFGLLKADIESVDFDFTNGKIAILTKTRDWRVERITNPEQDLPFEPSGLYVDMVASASVADQYDDVTFTWVSNAAASCVTRRGNSVWRSYVPAPLNFGQVSVDIEMVEAGDINFRIFCFDADGAVVAKQVNVVVNEAASPPPEPEPDPQTPTDPEPPVNEAVCNTSDVASGLELTWPQVFSAPDFPQAGSASDVRMRSQAYYAVPFNTGNFKAQASVSTVALQGGVRYVSVSSCPGNFKTDVAPECLSVQGQTSLEFTTDPLGQGCFLEPNTKYYVNFTYYDVNDIRSDDSSCGTSTFSECTMRITTLIKELP